MTEKNREKNESFFQAGLGSLVIAWAAGVGMGFGTDLIGESQTRLSREFAIRGEVQSAADILKSMYIVNPRLLALEGEVGTLAPGARGDVVISRQNPLEKIECLADSGNALSHVIQAGQVVRGEVS